MHNSNKTEANLHINVPRETLSTLTEFVSLLQKWQKSINLVSANTQEIWQRHIEDSYQLVRHLPERHSKVIDLGSGGGLPAIVMAITAPQHHYTLIESDRKKAIFLMEASRILGLKNIEVENKRVEQTEVRGDIITSRALADLQHLIELSTPLMKIDAFCLFLKGANWDMEVSNAKKEWSFQLEAFPSVTLQEARILKIDQISRITR